MKETSNNFKPYIIEGFVGPMKSGKTSALLKRVDPLRFDPRNYSYVGIKPKLDNRDFNSRTFEDFIEWNYLGKAEEIFGLGKEFDEEIVKVVLELQKQGKNIIFAGLDLDFKKEPFGAIKELMIHANELKKFHAICTECGNPAHYTIRLINGEPARFDAPIVSIEGESEYLPRCYKHHKVLGKD